VIRKGLICFLAWAVAAACLSPGVEARTGDGGPDPGPYAVACTNLQIDETLARPGVPISTYLRGGQAADGSLFYLDSLLAHPESVFRFNVAVPDDAAKYFDSAGLTVPIVGVIFYPTSLTNNRPDYEFPELSPAFPRMQRPGEVPIFPDEEARYPVLIYSHGLEDFPISGQQLLSHIRLASHGYIIVCLFHGDGRFPDDSWARFHQFPQRPLACKQALDHLGNHVYFNERIDWDRAAALGVSYGGSTVLSLTGARVTGGPSRRLVQFDVDPRLKAGAGIISYCGADGNPWFGNNFEGANTLFAPQMVICGDLDEIAPCSYSRSTLQASPQVGYHVTLVGSIHGLSTEAMYDANTWVLTFLEAYLKEDPQALVRLNTMGSVEGGPDDRVEIFNPASP